MTKQITQFNRVIIKEVAEDMKGAISSVAKKYGLVINYKGGRFSNISATVRFELNTVGTNGEVHSEATETFKRMAISYGFKESDLGANFQFQNELYTITGLTPRRHKFPISAKRVKDGKAFKFPINSVLAGLSRNFKPMRGAK